MRWYEVMVSGYWTRDPNCFWAVTADGRTTWKRTNDDIVRQGSGVEGRSQPPACVPS